MAFIALKHKGVKWRKMARGTSATNAIHPECTRNNYYFIFHGQSYHGYTQEKETGLSCSIQTYKATLGVRLECQLIL